MSEPRVSNSICDLDRQLSFSGAGYTESHEWVSVKGNVGTVGITHYAQKELGEVVYVELPQIGRSIKAGEEVCVLESTKAAVDVYSPVSGKIVAINESLRTSPFCVNKDAEKSGWLFQVELSCPSECKHLLTLSQYEALQSPG